MKIQEIIIWLIIFVIGSLIVNFLINPSSLDRFKDNLPEIEIERQDVNYTKIDMGNWLYSCSSLELGAQSAGISERENKKSACISSCGKQDLNYGKFECDRDHLICYCK